MRINKYLCECGICSRREADVMINAGRVFVNGIPADPGMQVTESDLVTVDSRPVNINKEKTYLAFNKPAGIVCTSDTREPDNIIDFIGYGRRITYAGRLDKDSEGLILLTDDGDLINLLMSASERHEKEYIVSTASDITDAQIKRMAGGLHLEEIGMDTRPCRVEQSGRREFHITLTQGINRQIRRMCKAVDLRVVSLKRVRIANIRLGNLKKGKYRKLSSAELSELKKIIGCRRTIQPKTE